MRSDSNASLETFWSTGTMSISVALLDTLGAFASVLLLLLLASPLRPDWRLVYVDMFFILLLSLGFVLLDARTGGEGLVFLYNEFSSVELSFCGAMAPFACSITLMATWLASA